MSVATCLKAARGLLICGWTNRDFLERCERQDGTPCAASDEGVFKFSVREALVAGAANPDECIEAYETLRWIIAPTHAAYDAHLATLRGDESKITVDFARKAIDLARASVEKLDMDAWIASPKRAHEQVLRAFDVAILRAVREATT